MHPRLYRLTEKHQRIDESLRLARSRPHPDWAEVVRLKELKLRVKGLIYRFTRTPVRS